MIYKVNDNLTTTKKIAALNNMILELYGLINKASFDKAEIDQIFADTPALERQFLRNQSLGSTLGTYTGWTHFYAESGYSIWKYTPTNYAYNVLNEVYLDNKLMQNRGLATAESGLTFDKVYFFDGSYTDNTTEAASETGTEFSLMDATGEYLYIGYATKFSGIKFEFQTRGSNYSLLIEFYNGSGWIPMAESSYNLDDNTGDFESDGDIFWDAPANWATNSVNGETKYWIRISTLTIPVTVAKAYYVIPANTVVGLLALSNSEILNEDWAFCSYSDSIYITLRNTGVSAYEGDYYITSSSSTINKLNYFTQNHEITANYANSLY